MGKGRMQTFRLNRKFSSEYALFIINGDGVEFRRFAYLGGPEIECKEMNLTAGRALYAQMLAEKQQVGHHLLPSEHRTVIWVPVQVKGRR